MVNEGGPNTVKDVAESRLCDYESCRSRFTRRVFVADLFCDDMLVTIDMSFRSWDPVRNRAIVFVKVVVTNISRCTPGARGSDARMSIVLSKLLIFRL